MISSNPQKLGSVDGADVIVQASSAGFTGQPLVKVSLTKQYNRAPPFGWIVGGTPAGSKAALDMTTGPRVLPIGAVLDLPRCEADALIAAGAATVV